MDDNFGLWIGDRNQLRIADCGWRIGRTSSGERGVGPGPVGGIRNPKSEIRNRLWSTIVRPQPAWYVAPLGPLAQTG